MLTKPKYYIMTWADDGHELSEHQVLEVARAGQNGFKIVYLRINETSTNKEDSK